MDPQTSNAFHTLGLREGADPEEIRIAFDQQMERFSEVNYLGSPLWDMAARRREEIRAAYALLTGGQEDGASAPLSAEESEAVPASGDRAESVLNAVPLKAVRADTDSVTRIRMLLNENEPDAAEEILRGLPDSEKNPELVFLRGMIAWKRGWIDEATQYVRRASEMDPGNPEYSSWVVQIRNASYARRRGTDKKTTICDALGACTCECLCESICEGICDSL